jgi:F5/8 type C domain
MQKTILSFLGILTICTANATEENLGLLSSGGTATASSNVKTMEAVKAYDGNEKTPWRAVAGVYPQVLIRNFEKSREINKITTVFDEYYAYQYTIYVSDKEKPSDNLHDKNVWKKLVGPKMGCQDMTDTFKPLKVRHVATEFTTLLSNGSLEKNDEAKASKINVCTDWENYSKAGVTMTWNAKIAHSGKHSIEIFADKNAAKFHLYHKLIPVKPESKYVLSVYIRCHEEGETALVGVRADQLTAQKKWAQFTNNNEASKRTKWGPFKITTTKWKKLTFNIKTTANCFFLHPGIFYYKSKSLPTNHFYVDDIFLVEGEDEGDISGILEQKIFNVKGN